MMGAIVGKRLRNGMSVVVIVVAAVAGSEGTGAQAAGKRQVAKVERLAVVRPRCHSSHSPLRLMLSTFLPSLCSLRSPTSQATRRRRWAPHGCVVGQLAAPASAPAFGRHTVTLERTTPQPGEGRPVAQTTGAASPSRRPATC